MNKKIKKQNKKHKIIFISSMGGHLSELLCLDSLILKYDSLIVTEKSLVTEFLKEKYKNVEYVKFGTRRNPFKYFFIILFNFFKSLNIFLKFKPDMIITTGTHTAIPMIYIAKLFGKKVIYIETYANITTKTLAGKIAEPIADKIIVQWEEMKPMYKKSVYLGGIF